MFNGEWRSGTTVKMATGKPGCFYPRDVAGTVESRHHVPFVLWSQPAQNRERVFRSALIASTAQRARDAQTMKRFSCLRVPADPANSSLVMLACRGPGSYVVKISGASLTTLGHQPA